MIYYYIIILSSILRFKKQSKSEIKKLDNITITVLVLETSEHLNIMQSTQTKI